MKLEKLGMRTIKSGIAVTCCVIIAKYLVQNPMYCAVACIISVQDTVRGSLKAGFGRVKGTIIGGIIGFLLVLIQPKDPILCGIGSIITIYLCNILKINSAITVASVTFISIYLGVIEVNPAIYSFNRVLDTSIGVIIGIFINYIIVRPDYLESSKKELKKFERLTLQSIELKIIDKERFNILKLEKEVKKLENIYSKLIDELKYTKDDINTDKVETTMKICKEIYFHMQSIELLEKKLYLNEKNYNNLKKLYSIDNIDWEINEEKSPVFNYHLSKIIEEVNMLNDINNSNY